MARKSQASLDTPTPVKAERPRLKPTDGMPKHAREVFDSIVNSLPPDHFHPADAYMLRQYCVAVMIAEQAEKELTSKPITKEGRASPWLVVQEKQTRAIATLGTKLRLTTQSRMSSYQAGKNGRERGTITAERALSILQEIHRE